LLAPQFTKIFGRRLRFIQTEIYWAEKGKLFDDIGCDIVVVVSPYDIKMMTRDAEITRDICANPADFGKPTKNYSKLLPVLQLYEEHY
jgi:hypothetical protein